MYAEEPELLVEASRRGRADTEIKHAQKLADSFVVIGKGHKKMICLCNSGDRNLKNYSSTPIILKKKSTGSSALEESTIGACQQLGSSSDDLSEDEPNINPDIDGSYVFNEHLDSFGREIQELLVCYSCPVPLGNFESLYELVKDVRPVLVWRIIDYESFGVTGLEELVEKNKISGGWAHPDPKHRDPPTPRATRDGEGEDYGLPEMQKEKNTATHQSPDRDRSEEEDAAAATGDRQEDAAAARVSSDVHEPL
ncbi:unnamed protein product [Miscanthus lutarioriparius]|uniref:Uncharacterized protein n=1 Tax=Miscanthus lutarioriparius TaxID=422564 RepID=A0A811RDH3_9POAL|nr:unnamed protein product [Miscanthus lutarioriparius]